LIGVPSEPSKAQRDISHDHSDLSIIAQPSGHVQGLFEVDKGFFIATLPQEDRAKAAKKLKHDEVGSIALPKLLNASQGLRVCLFGIPGVKKQ